LLLLRREEFALFAIVQPEFAMLLHFCVATLQLRSPPIVAMLLTPLALTTQA
jgi:hypothetical protein